MVYEYFVFKLKYFYQQGIHMLLKKWQLGIDNDGEYIIDWLNVLFLFTFQVEKYARTYGLIW